MMREANIERFPPLHVGDTVQVERSSVFRMLEGSIGTVVVEPDAKKSPYKSVAAVNLRGLGESGNPWIFFRYELKKIHTFE